VSSYGQFARTEFGVQNSIKYHTIFKGPGIKHSGVFYFIEKGFMKTDYKNLNNRIVKQAWEVSNLTLSEEMKTRLFQNKIDRAKQMIEARAAVYYKTDK
jgi:hypothetical protein